MEIISDLHIHSRFSRACSKDITIENLEKWAKIKGVNLLGTGDFQHAKWFKELDELEERDGILYTNNEFPFVWQTEISLMYTQNGKGRRIHYVILAPNKDIVKQITNFLASKGRLDYDGRPIFGFNSIELVDNLLNIDKNIEIIPAHCMTPFFGNFGSKSGFNNLKECFQDREKDIHAVESGMSADPEMLRKFSFLNNKTIVSFSDLHSFWPWRIGREATIFDLDPKKINYKDIIKQIRENKIIGTIETDPTYGKYHFDGHRLCNFSCGPEESRKLNNICPVCKKSLTIGVENRVEELTDQEPDKNPNRKKYYKMIPLHEIISAVIGGALNTKKVWAEYNKLIENFGNEFNILLNVNKEELNKVTNAKISELIIKNREGKIKIKPGYDGVYGIPILDNSEKIQKNLGDF
mgnify:CR=1 FL=1